MNLPFKNKRLVHLVIILIGGTFTGLFLFWSLWGTVWTQADFQVLDIFYRHAVRHGYRAPLSSQIVYLVITDASYDFWGKNILDRTDLAAVNQALALLNVEAVAYDIIFARPSHSTADRQFAESITQLGAVYLPIGLEYSQKPRNFHWEEGVAYERLRTEYLHKPMQEEGAPHPLYATRALMQADLFAKVATGAGHISALSDPDGIYRHVPLLLKIDSLYLPTLSLAMFLDYVGVSFEDIRVDWGHAVVIPATKQSFLEQDVVIPIDEQGRVFIPYPHTWSQSFPAMEAHRFLQYMEREDLRGNLGEFFEGKFVFIGDIAIGISDLGQTPLEDDVPLLVIHASLFNGLLTNTFYHKWSFWQVIGFLGFLAGLVGLAALPKSPWVLYLAGGSIVLGIIGFTWFQFLHFALFPVVTVGGSFGILFLSLITGLQVAMYKDRAFIRNAFAKYVPETVVNELIRRPELLKLGGEERVLTVLFADLAGFTSLAEYMAPAELVSLLNTYLTEMTTLVLAEGGIIDKYEGDAIMAEFGAPLPLPDHADRAVRASLKMQRRLGELREKWKTQGLPELQCRIGINTGPMVIGNMGSHQVFDYTVIGDAVNLAARLESANKRYNTSIMLSEFTYTLLTPGCFRTRVLDVVKVKGRTRAVKVFEVYGEAADPIDAADLYYYQSYQEGFEAYLAKNFATAREKFSLAVSLRPFDPAAREMIARIDALKPDELPADWDGSVILTVK